MEAHQALAAYRSAQTASAACSEGSMEVPPVMAECPAVE